MGLMAADSDAAGAASYAQPEWRAGERRVYLRGEVLRLELRVERDGDNLRLVDDQTGLRTLYGPTLTELGQEKDDAPELTFNFDPADHQLTWPLWVGKRWTTHFVTRGAGRPDTPWIASYHCDALEAVAVPAGEFQTLRIWRRARPALPGQFAERTSVVWYAPEPGFFVRRLSDGMLTELLSVQAP